MGESFSIKTWLETNVNNTYRSLMQNNYHVSPVNVCLVVLTANCKRRYPKGAVQQMEVEIAALYKTMHTQPSVD